MVGFSCLEAARCLKHSIKQRLFEIQRTHTVRTILEDALEPEFTHECEGDKRLRLIRKILDSYGPQWKRSEHQKMFHHAFITSCLAVIYGSDWATHSLRVLQTFGVTDIRYGALCRTPRRFGKTKAVAMFVAAMLLAIPGVVICIYSTGRRASKSLTSDVVRYVCKIKGGQRRIICKNQEELFISEKALPYELSRSDPRVGLLANKDTTSRCYSLPTGGVSKSSIY